MGDLYNPPCTQENYSRGEKAHVSLLKIGSLASKKLKNTTSPDTNVGKKNYLGKGHHNTPSQMFMQFLEAVSLKLPKNTSRLLREQAGDLIGLHRVLGPKASKNPVFPALRASPLSC